MAVKYCPEPGLWSGADLLRQEGGALMSDYEILTVVVAILVLTETIRNSRQ